MSKDTKLIETLETHAETGKQTAAPELCAPASPLQFTMLCEEPHHLRDRSNYKQL